jgi:hypothetical protein
MHSELLHVIAVYSNPIRWTNRSQCHALFEKHMLASGVRLTMVECAFGERPFELPDDPEINRIRVRTNSMVWHKENLINIGISRLPHDWEYVACLDADIFFRNRHWAAETVHALQHYQVVQPWADAYDLGPDGEHLDVHRSFLRQWFNGVPIVPKAPRWWRFQGGPYDYAHPGYAWAYRREALDRLGGLFELCALGEGDNVMARALIGACESGIPKGMSASYVQALKLWQERALQHVHFRLGYVKGTIEHRWHGPKDRRGYVSRWGIALKHGFDPVTDLKKNVHGVLELAGNKPMLQHDIDGYFRSRFEDSNSLD